MTATAVALLWLTGLILGFLIATVMLLRRQVQSLRSRLMKLEAVAENQDARMFCVEQEQRWLAAKSKQHDEMMSGH